MKIERVDELERVWGHVFYENDLEVGMGYVVCKNSRPLLFVSVENDSVFLARMDDDFSFETSLDYHKQNGRYVTKAVLDPDNLEVKYCLPREGDKIRGYRDGVCIFEFGLDGDLAKLYLASPYKLVTSP
jgi:hypothetical protein